jgi:class 3 adenylate cyclase
MKYLLIFSLLLSTTLSAQTPDEIERATADVEELIAQATQHNNPKQAIELAEQALIVARSLRYNGGILQANVLLGTLKTKINKPEEAIQHYLEAEAKAQASGNKKGLTAIYSAIADIFLSEKLFSSARRYYQNVLKTNGNDDATLEKLADTYLYEQASDSAEYFYKKLILKYRNENEVARQIRIYQKLANAYDQQGNAGKCLYYYLPIESLVEQYGSMQEKSILYNNLGRQYASQKQFDKAIEYFHKSELQCVYIPCDYPDVLYANMGIALHNNGNTKQGIEYLLKARALLEAKKDDTALANLEHLIAGVYLNENDYYNAITHNNLAIRLAKETNQQLVLAETYRTAADLYHALYDFEKAFEYYKDYLTLMDAVRLEEQAREQRINQQRALLAEAEGQIKYLIARQNFKDLEISQIKYERERLELLNKNLELESKQKEDQLLLLQKQKEVDLSVLREQSLQALKARQELRIAANDLKTEKQSRTISNLKAQEAIERAKQAQQLEKINREKDIAQLQLQKQQTFRKFALGLGLLLLIILGLLTTGWFFARRTNNRLNKQNTQIQQQNIELETERQKSDQLLLNILPKEIAGELKINKTAKAQQYDQVTIMFTDFVNFTKLSETIPPNQILRELNDCFSAFDEICETCNLEIIKTIGDAFMCAGGIPVKNNSHPYDAVNAAIKMSNWLKKRNQDHPTTTTYKEMRIGIHTGPVVAGVVGKKKFAYDIWGDAVNMAARLEQYGEPGKINVSAETAALIKNKYQLVSHSKEVPGKGLIEMFLIKL